MAKDILCPYCIEKLGANSVDFLCSSCRNIVKPSKIDLLLKRIPKCQNEGCRGGIANYKQCSNCKTELPPDILEYKKYLRFCLLGLTGSGKTNFLTVLLHEIRNSANTPWIFAAMNDMTQGIYDSNVSLVIDGHEPAAATIPGAPPIPQQWRVSDRSRIKGNDIPAYSLTIFDGAGEDVERIDPTISRYISGARTLIILMDPLSIPEVRKSVSEEIISNSTTTIHENGDSAKMVDGLANYIRSSCGISPGKLISKEVAIVFTKIDAVRESFGSSTVMQPSPHLERGGFVKADGDAVHAEIKDWLVTHNASSFLNALDSNFDANKLHMFGVSSFGQPPKSNGNLGKVMPHRVLDPIIWMLSKEGIAKII